jgi:hypothetical protein
MNTWMKSASPTPLLLHRPLSAQSASPTPLLLHRPLSAQTALPIALVPHVLLFVILQQSNALYVSTCICICILLQSTTIFMLFYIFRAFGFAVVLKLLGTNCEFNNKKWNSTFIPGNIGTAGHRYWDCAAQRLRCAENVLHRKRIQSQSVCMNLRYLRCDAV